MFFFFQEKEGIRYIGETGFQTCALPILPSAAQQWRTRLAAVLEGRAAVASHVTALALWGLVAHPAGPVHVSVDTSMSARGSTGVVVHRAPGVHGERRRVDGLAVRLEGHTAELQSRPYLRCRLLL